MTASAQYEDVGTPFTIQDSGGSVVCTLSSLAALAGRLAARLDLGAWPSARRFRWNLTTAWVSAPVAGETLDAFLATWDNDTGPASPQANVAATDSAMTITQRQNMTYIGSAVAETASTNIGSGEGIIESILGRYITFGFYNASAAKALAGVGTTPTILRLTPQYREQQ